MSLPVSHVCNGVWEILPETHAKITYFHHGDSGNQQAIQRFTDVEVDDIDDIEETHMVIHLEGLRNGTDEEERHADQSKHAKGQVYQNDLGKASVEFIH